MMHAYTTSLSAIFKDKGASIDHTTSSVLKRFLARSLKNEKKKRVDADHTRSNNEKTLYFITL